jgi:DNA-directed RNA polymerase subunit E"
MVTKKKACKDCKTITTQKECPQCGSKSLSEKYKGNVIILDEKNSEIAKKLNIEKKGDYALKL